MDEVLTQLNTAHVQYARATYAGDRAPWLTEAIRRQFRETMATAVTTAPRRLAAIDPQAPEYGRLLVEIELASATPAEGA